MGKELRMVVPNWDHPSKEEFNYNNQKVKRFQPMYDQPYIEAITEWIKNHQLWEKGEHPDQKAGDMEEFRYYAEWDGSAPRVEYYRPNWKDEDMTWYQVYETVSEGTPVTPPFETREELVEYLVKNGDFWDQERRRDGCTIMPCAPWTREEATAFVFGRGWSPSMVISNGKIMSGVQALAYEEKK